MRFLHVNDKYLIVLKNQIESMGKLRLQTPELKKCLLNY